MGTVVFIKIRFRSIAARAGTVIRYVAFRATVDRADFFTVPFFEVRDEVFVIPVLPKVSDQRELVDLEFLVLWRMGIIKSPLLERDISTDKLN